MCTRLCTIDTPVNVGVLPASRSLRTWVTWLTAAMGIWTEADTKLDVGGHGN